MGVKIFVLNVGRSGSKTLAKQYGLLHEPDGPQPDVRNVVKRAEGKLLYGETSHFWKAHLEKLLETFPEATYIHLVRDPRKVVASFEHRAHYKEMLPGRPYQEEILPIDGFLQMSRFEKLCSYWRYWNECIEDALEIWDHPHWFVRLEDLDLTVQENKGPKHRVWTPQEKKLLWDVCGGLAERYGYEK